MKCTALYGVITLSAYSILGKCEPEITISKKLIMLILLFNILDGVMNKDMTNKRISIQRLKYLQIRSIGIEKAKI